MCAVVLLANSGWAQDTSSLEGRRADGRRDADKSHFQQPADSTGTQYRRSPTSPPLGRNRPSPQLRVEPREDHPYQRVNIWTDRRIYHPGDRVNIYFTVSTDAYVYIFNTDTNGVTRQIFPNYYERDNRVRQNITYSIPDRSYQLTISGPPGYESLHIIAYPERYGIYEPFHEYNSRQPFLRAPSGGKNLQQHLDREDYEKFRRKEQSARDAQGQSIIVEPRPDEAEFDYLEDWTTFLVRSHYSWGGRDPRRDEPGRDYPPDYRNERETGNLRIITQPQQAAIYINDRFQGFSPTVLEDLPYGEYLLRIERRGFRPEERWIRINQRGTNTFQISLQRD